MGSEREAVGCGFKDLSGRRWIHCHIASLFSSKRLVPLTFNFSDWNPVVVRFQNGSCYG